MKRAEAAIQRQVFEHYRARGAPNTFMFAVPNGGKRGLVEAVNFKREGVTAGVPDIIAIRSGEVFGLELKAAKGKLSPAQKDVQRRMRDAGSFVGNAKGLDEALYILEFWGILRGAVEKPKPAAQEAMKL
jgi:hypothetical protein